MNSDKKNLLKKLENALRKSWSKKTCYEKVQENWKKEIPETGQCAVTALIINDYLGGEIVRSDTNTGVSHFWNIVDGVDVDLTKNQFDENIKFFNIKKVDRKDMENERYFILKEKISKILM